MHVGQFVVLILLLLFLPLHGFLCLAQMVEEEEAASGISFRLHVSPPVLQDSLEERRAHYRAMEARDLLRHRHIAMRRLSQEFELPIQSAMSIVKVGMYLVTVHIGTPAQPFSMALDLASDLTWLNCRLRRRKGKHYGLPPVEKQSRMVSTQSTDMEGEHIKVVRNWYRPGLSSSWRRYRCSQKRQCIDMLNMYTTCNTSNRTESCTYDHQTLDGTRSMGIFGQDKATVALGGSGGMTQLPGVMLGCSTHESGGSVDAHDGILTLGNHEMSFGIIAAKRFGNCFSFCLLNAASDRTASSYLTFGPNPTVPGPGLMETKLVYPLQTVGYGSRVTGILVGGELLDIPPDVWDDTMLGGGVIFDTSTSLTSLVPSAYEAVTKALDKHLAHLERYDMDGFEFCYNWTFTGSADGVDPVHNVTIPKLVIEFEGGARLEPDATSFILPEVYPGVACQGLRSVGGGPGLMTAGVPGPSIIGNVLMQDHIWEFDLLNEKLRFRKDKCIDSSSSSSHHSSSSSSSSSSPSN